MTRRVLSLIAFRVIILCVSIVYQLLAFLVGLRTLPFEPFMALIIVMSMANWFYFWFLKKFQDQNARLRQVVLFQFLLDGAALSVVVWLTGGVESSFSLSYLVIIPLSAVFLPKISIYVITVFCFSSYYVAAIKIPPWEYLVGGLQMEQRSEIFSYTIAGQFVIFFGIALVSAFLQSTYKSTLRDLSVKEKSIRSLKRVRNRIVESMHSGLITCDLQGRITYANKTALRLLDSPESAIQGTSAWDMFLFSKDDFRSLELGTLPHRAVKWVNLPNAKKLFGISLSRLEFDPDVFGYLIVFQDLTEIKMLEEKHRFDDKMATVGKVAAGVAHEIRNPLASIVGSIQVLRDFVPRDPAARELMEIVEKESGRLEEIISNFLTFTRPSSPSEMKPIDLVALFQRFLKLAANDQDIKKVVLETRIETPEGYVFGDETKIMQIWWNLFRNAAQASRSGDRIDVFLNVESSDTVFRIEDHGVGMSEDQLADLFTPFQSFRRGGSGLGMSIVYELVQLHHGTIHVDSQLGSGTKVTLRFPKYQEGD